MKFYKLELINREENYNKIFGAHPVVGIFNPLDKKPAVNFIRNRKFLQQLPILLQKKTILIKSH